MMAPDPIMIFGYGPNSDVGTVMRQGYIGIGEIIRQAIQQMGAARRELRVIARRFTNEFDLHGNVMIPFDIKLGLKANTLRGFASFVDLLANTAHKLEEAFELKANTSRVIKWAGNIYSNTLVQMREEFNVKANTLREFVSDFDIRGRRDMTRFIEEFILDEDEDDNT